MGRYCALSGFLLWVFCGSLPLPCLAEEPARFPSRPGLFVQNVSVTKNGTISMDIGLVCSPGQVSRLYSLWRSIGRQPALQEEQGSQRGTAVVYPVDIPFDLLFVDEEVCNEDGKYQLHEVESDRFLLAGRCSPGGKYEAGGRLGFETITCSDGVVVEVQGELVHIDPGRPRFAVGLDGAASPRLDEDLGVAMEAVLVSGERSDFAMVGSWKQVTNTGSQKGGMASSEEIDLLDLDLLWLYTLFDRGRLRIQSRLGGGFGFAFEDNGALGDSPASVAGLRFEWDLNTRNGVFVEVGGRWILDRELQDFAFEYGLGFTF